MSVPISLLREKFTIREIGIDSVPVIALGNRVTLPLPKTSTPLIIRGHSMHMTLRYAAEILKQLSFISHVENIDTIIKWDELWEKVIEPHERINTPETWISVYYGGRLIYSFNPHHMFFDILEQCEYKNKKTSHKYEQSILTAQNAFQKMGRHVFIEQESHVGFILDESDKELRFAIILRLPWQRATFITRISDNKTHMAKPHDYNSLSLAADYIEGINLAVRSGFLEAQFKSGKPNPDQNKVMKVTQKRLQTLILSIEQIEKKYTTKYRPERPDFKTIQQKCVVLASGS